MDNQINGRIVGMMYQGDYVELKIHLSGNREYERVTARLDARLSRKDNFLVGQEVTIQWDKECSSALQG